MTNFTLAQPFAVRPSMTNPESLSALTGEIAENHDPAG
jgi:hypothetical protein